MKAGLLFGVMTFCVVATAYPQGEMNHWYFGYNAGLDFSSGGPVAATGSLRNWEGCSSISDKDGQLLFYTDGITVWNRSHQVMPNGANLQGDTMSTQSTLIAGYPGNDSLFYIFTTVKEGEPGGLRYSLVNMKLNGGAGGVVAAEKNMPLLAPVCEKITAVKHRNTKDVWIITRKYGSNEFYVYLLDCRGLHTTPTITAAGNVTDRIVNAIGYLKASPDGSRLAMASFSAVVEIFDFDNQSGQISNARAIAGNPNLTTGPYGLEFSSNAKYLYVSESYNNNGSGAYYVTQYQVNAPSVASTRIAIDSGYSNTAGALQLGPDQKIYIAYDRQDFLGAITKPDSLGVLCGVVKQYVHLQAGTVSGIGLPAFTADYKRTLLGEDTTMCSNENRRKVIRLALPATSYVWQDGSVTDSMVITQPGKYYVNITYNGCQYSDTFQMLVRPGPAFSLGKDTILCKGNTLSLNVASAGVSYSWQDGSTGSTYLINRKGLYYVAVSKNNCTMSDSIDVTYEVVPAPWLGPDKKLCPGQDLVLEPGVAGTTYKWQDGAGSLTYKVTEPGIYSVAVTNLCGTGSDEIVVDKGPCPLAIPNAFTPGKTTNRSFRLLNATGIKKFSLRVYSRWGQLLYQSADPSTGWDGSFNGMQQPAGIYVYMIAYTDALTATETHQKGLLTLIR